MSGVRPKRVAFLLPSMAGGGAERVTLTLVNHFVAAKHDVDLLLTCAEGGLLGLVPPEVRIIDLKAKRFRQAFAGLWRYLRRERPDALQVSMWPLTIVGILAHRLSRSRARLVISEHTVLSDHYRGRTARILMRLTTVPLYPLASARVAVSNGVAEDLGRIASMNPQDFCIVPNPIDVPGSIKSTRAVERLWSGARTRILAVGRFTPEKNHALLLHAFARMGRKDAKLMILGEGRMRPDLERLAVELGLVDRVVLPGFQLDPWPFYGSASLFVLSSDYEGFSNVILEAMAAGLPVVSTDCPSGPAEILDHGRFGALVPVGDAAAMAAAMECALDAPGDSEARKERAASISQGSARRYRALLVPEHPNA